MEKLLLEQSTAGKSLERMLVNFYKDSKSRKTVRYFENRIKKLTVEWNQFARRDDELQGFRPKQPDHQYFEEDYFGQVREIYEELKGEFEDGLSELKAMDGSNVGQSSTSLAQPGTKAEQQDVTKRLMLQESLMSSLSRIMATVTRELEECPSHSHVFYQQHITSMRDYWTSISNNHHSLVAENTSYDASRFYQLEDTYNALVVKLKELDEQNSPSTANVGTHGSSTLRLPKVIIPTFDGDYLKWTSFAELFEQLVDSQDIPSVQKMFYLKSNLAGEASRLIQHLQASELNYATAWKILRARYDNQRLIVAAFLNSLLSIPVATRESSSHLKKLHDTVNESLLGIKNLGISTSSWDPLMVHILLQKVDKETHRLFEQSLSDTRKLQPLATLLNFIEARFQLLESLGDGPVKSKTEKRASSLFTAKEKQPCPVCKQECKNLRLCQKFLQMNVKERFSTVKRLQHCINCLQKGHTRKDCSSGSCMKCKKRHHTLIHFEKSIEPVQHTNQPIMENRVSNSASSPQKAQHYVFLGTASIKIKDSFGQFLVCRAILDSGSQLNFISERLFKKLGFRGFQNPIDICGIGSSKLHSKGRINITIQSRVNEFATVLEFVILPEITSYQPAQICNIKSWPIPGNIQLADPDFNTPKRVDILIGAEIYADLMSPEKIKLSSDLPTLQNSILGWIVLGKVNTAYQNFSTVCNIATSSIEDQLKRFWELENVESYSPAMTENEKKCEQHFVKTIRKSPEGKFEVRLPFAESPSSLGDSKLIAIRRLLSQERRLERNPELKQQYKQFMDELLALNHMELIDRSSIPKSHYFLPHHYVLKPDSTTTKLRVVFDGSCKTSTNISLNNLLLVGPVVQDELFAILVRFRLHRYVFSADIEKMYRQILVAEEDRNFQLVLWRDNPSEAIKFYRLRTVTYGTASAPYLATRTLQYLAETKQREFPLGSKAALRDFYVDDILSGANSLQEALRIQSELRTLLSEGGFLLRKWCANHPKLIQHIPKEDLQAMTMSTTGDDYYTKSLGIAWHPNTDTYGIKVNLSSVDKITKRSVLSDIMHIYDPLGLINPIVSKGKIFIQELWQHKLDWDNEIPEALSTKWRKFREELTNLNSIVIPRRAVSDDISSIELHAFSDASESAFGAAIYIRSMDSTGRYITHLLCARSRVAPLKRLTIPRLELCAAHLMVKFVIKLQKALGTPMENIYYWTDSTITLSWIKGSSANWKTFVANRVAFIQENTKTTQWKYVPTAENPADILSRGATPGDLSTSKIWFRGPKFLELPNSKWPKPPVKHLEVDEEKKSKALVSVQSSTSILSTINHRNSFKFLQRTIAYIRRFAQNLKPDQDIKTGPISPSELHDALVYIIREVQHTAFKEDLKHLTKHATLPAGNALSHLKPFVDDKGLLRVGGRIDNSNLPYEAKHQLLLPHSNEVVSLLIQYLHEKHLHAGPQALLAILRQEFWPIRGKTLVQSVVQKCIRCCKAKPKLYTQIMGNLPKERVRPGRPFTNVGVDFCGPIQIHHKIRGKKPTKAYISVFICFSTKAVHLELVSDLTKDAFLGALKRFLARRGRPCKIFCDNATNFVGAKNELKEVRELFLNKLIQNEIQTYCADERIEWCFIPPRSPHFGGLWEAAVKSAKYHIKRVVAGASLTYEELHTTVTEIEAILNSRPLTPLTSNPNDLQALTPGHFLIGEPLSTLPNPEYLESNIKLLQRWKLVQACQMDFWKRWSKEYLQELQTRDDCRDLVGTIATEEEPSDTDDSKHDTAGCDPLELQFVEKMNDSSCNSESSSHSNKADETPYLKTFEKQNYDANGRKHLGVRVNQSLASDPALQPEAKDLKLLTDGAPCEEITLKRNDRTRSPDSELLQRMKFFICHPCGIGFSSLSTLEAHQTYYCSHRKDSEPEVNPTNLIESDIVPRSESSLKSAKTGKQYVCNQCSYSADKKVSLNRHMRMHQSSPVSISNISNGDDNASQQTDRYCSECDIRFSNIKTYRAHKQHYCHSRRIENVPTTSDDRKGENSSPDDESSTQISSLQPFLALPTNPILIIPYKVLKMATVLPGPLASILGEIDDSSSSCFAYENGSMNPIAIAISTRTHMPCDNAALNTITKKTEKQLEVLKDSDRKTVSPRLTTMIVDNIITRESNPLDLSVRKSASESFSDEILLKNDRTDLENILSVPCSPNTRCSPSLSFPLSANTEKASINAFDFGKTTKSREIGTTISELKNSIDIPIKPAITIDSNVISLNTTLISAATMAAVAPSVSNIPPQIYVKQGVSKCKECNIVFCKHENYLAHKQHYCSARRKEEAERTNVTSPENQPEISTQVAYQQLICAACGIKYTSLDNLRAHQSFYCPKGIDLQATAEKKKCSKCNKQHDSNQCTSSEISYKCPVCDVISESAVERKKHLETHGSVKAFRCTICRYKGNTLRGMRIHIRMHFEQKTPDFNEEKYMSCIIEEDLTEIKSSDTTNQQNFKCESCTYSSSYKGNVVRHRKLVHSPTQAALKMSTEKLSPDINGESETPDDCLGVKIELFDGCGSSADDDIANVKAETEENIRSEPISSALTSPQQQLTSDSGSIKYCKICDITFKYLNSFIAHKKFYCKREQNNDAEMNLDFHEQPPRLTISQESVEAVL